MKLIFDYLLKQKVKKNEPIPLKKFDVGWAKTDIESLKFLHQEAAVRVKDTIDDHQSISKKAFSLILLFITISSILCGFLFGKNEFYMNVLAVMALIICLVNVYVLSELIRPIKFKAPGRDPKKVISQKYFSENRTKDENQKLIVYGELLNCQSQIDLNQYYNTIRLNIIDYVIRLVLVTFATLGILLIILKIIS